MTGPLDGLPVCPVRRLPVPYSSGRDPDGTGRFGVNDPDAKRACALAGWCGVCGGPMDGEIAFLAADRGDPARLLFTDPGMHVACAEASMQACPFIAGERVPRRVGPAGPKPGWLMVITRSYELAPAPPAAAAVVFTFRPGPLLRVRRFAYGPGGRLRETGPRGRVA